MPGFMPGIHVLLSLANERRGWPDKPGHDATESMPPNLKRLGVVFVFVAYRDDVRVHRLRRDRALAAQDRLHHTVMLDMRLGQPAEVAELRASERLNARPRGERDLGEIVVVRAGIDAGVEGFVRFVIALRVTALDQHAQPLVDVLEGAPL